MENTHDCRWCKFLSPEGDGIPPESRYFWYECHGNTGYDNLKNFPFNNTKCKRFDKRLKYLRPRFSEFLRKKLITIKKHQRKIK